MINRYRCAMELKWELCENARSLQQFTTVGVLGSNGVARTPVEANFQRAPTRNRITIKCDYKAIVLKSLTVTLTTRMSSSDDMVCRLYGCFWMYLIFLFLSFLFRIVSIKILNLIFLYSCRWHSLILFDGVCASVQTWNVTGGGGGGRERILQCLFKQNISLDRAQAIPIYSVCCAVLFTVFFVVICYSLSINFVRFISNIWWSIESF